jgi:hypothetical protein
MKRKAFELISSYESEEDGSIGHGEELEGASSGESPAPSGYGGIEGVRDQVENRGQDDLGHLIAQSDVLRNLAEQNRAVIASRRLRSAVELREFALQWDLVGKLFPMYMRRRMAQETPIQLVKLMPVPDVRPLAKFVLWKNHSFTRGKIHASPGPRTDP